MTRFKALARTALPRSRSSVEAATAQTLATIRAEVSDARHDITEEIAVANRATHDALVAMIKGPKK